MSGRDSAVPAERTPTPTPASEARVAFRHRFAAAFAEVIEGMDLATCDEIHRRYGGDPEREIADITQGLHPLQRGGRARDAYPQYEAKLARIRAKLGTPS